MNEYKEEVQSIRSLRDFLSFLEDHGQFVTWPDPVLPEPDIRNIAVAAGKDSQNSPAILFDRVRGYPDKRTVLGVHGSFATLALLLGHDRNTPIKDLFYDMVDRWGSEEGTVEWVDESKAPVFQNRLDGEDVNLFEMLPMFRINRYDGGFYVDKSNVVSRDPRDPEDFGKQNVGIYRLQIHGPDRLSLYTFPVHNMGRHIVEAEKRNERLPIAIMIGNHPSMAMFAATPIDYAESEFHYAAAMMGAPLELTKSQNGLDIQARAEMVIEAELLPGERIVEGPFGEFPATYSGVNKAPLFKVTGVSFRDDFIFENLYHASRWSEHDTLIGLSTSVPIYTQIKKDFDEVKAVNALYEHGMTGIISLENRTGGIAKTIALRALSTPHGTRYLKNLILVSEDVDPFNFDEIMWSLSTRTRAEDVMLLEKLPGIPIDPSARNPGLGHRLIIDATKHTKPSYVRPDAQTVTPPSGTKIEDLLKKIQYLQEETID